MNKFIRIVEILCASFIVLGGINVFFPLNYWFLDTEFFAQLAYGAIVAYAIVLCIRKRKQCLAPSLK